MTTPLIGNALVDAALAYAARDWYVLPLHDVTQGHCSCSNPHCEAPGIEPRSSESPLDVSDTHTPAQTTHIRALRPSRALYATPHDAPRLHEQYTAVQEQRAPGVHADLQAVITAWPTLSETVRATILRLIEAEEVRA